LANIAEEVRSHSHIYPDDITYNDFSGDRLGFYPKHLQEIIAPTYVSIREIVIAIKSGEIMDEQWFDKNRFL
jgi:hypothetical protein